MRWSTKQRMAFIADRLASTGRINRRDIMSHFEVSAPQASADFRRFEREHPGAMRYDSRRKSYFAVKEGGRDTTAAAKRLMYAEDAELAAVLRHDPDMIRDVAAALIHSRPNG